MPTTIHPRGNYYLQDGSFHLKNSWSKWFRLTAIVCLFIFGSFITANAKYYHHEIAVSVIDNSKFAFREAAIADWVKRTNSKISTSEAMIIIQSIEKWAKKFDIDPTVLYAVTHVESRFNKHAISDAGALGLMQVIPSWHLKKIKAAKEELGSPELFNVDTNVFLGAWVLRDCINLHKTLSKGLLCYNGSLSKPTDYDKKVLMVKNEVDEVIRNKL